MTNLYFFVFSSTMDEYTVMHTNLAFLVLLLFLSIDA